MIALAGFLGGVGPSLAELVSLCKHESVPEESYKAA